MNSCIKQLNGLPVLFVNDQPLSEMAYITYRTEHNCYEDFAAAGVKLYSVNLNFSEMPINERAPVLFFQKGIFENDVPDFSIVDKNISDIMTAVPDALIFPRVNVNLSETWEKAHPEELCHTGVGTRKRVSFASDVWAREVKQKLKHLIEYIESKDYADRIIGYQIAGGNTEEWLPFEDNGFYGERAKEKFLSRCRKENILPNEESYFEFTSEIVAERIIEFAEVAKSASGYRKIVGTFYGYTLGCTARNICHHSLYKILESDKIDFICSPIVYVHGREPGIDPYPMVPVDSVRLHNKLYFSENDIRTHLSEAIHSHPNYTSKIWFGPQDKGVCLNQLKASFCRAFVHGYGMWWFDMWGGWYKDALYMDALLRMSGLCKDGMDKPYSELAVFIDEKCYPKTEKKAMSVNHIINAVGISGCSYDVYLASDFEEVFEKYKAYIFIEPCKTQLLTRCIEKAKEFGVPFTVIPETSEGGCVEAVAKFLSESKITRFTNNKAAVFTGERYVCLYAGETGMFDFEADGKSTFTDLFTGEQIVFPRELEKSDCFLFER